MASKKTVQGDDRLGYLKIDKKDTSKAKPAGSTDNGGYTKGGFKKRKKQYDDAGSW